MSTLISIPGHLIRDRNLDVNAFLLRNGYTVVTRTRSREQWDIEVNENLDQTQQTALNDALLDELSGIKFTVR